MFHPRRRIRIRSCACRAMRSLPGCAAACSRPSPQSRRSDLSAHAEVRICDRGLPRTCGGDRIRRTRRLAAARRVRGKHPAEAIEGVRSVLRVLVLFALVTPFWSLFDQKASTWVLQADAMTKPSWFQPSQMQALNPALVMLLIPFNNLVLYPALRRFGYELTALRRMTAGHRLCRSRMDRRRLFNGEFDSGSERTLAAWIRHASRTGFSVVAIRWKV
jgi:hypothetical protein